MKIKIYSCFDRCLTGVIFWLPALSCLPVQIQKIMNEVFMSLSMFIFWFLTNCSLWVPTCVLIPNFHSTQYRDSMASIASIQNRQKQSLKKRFPLTSRAVLWGIVPYNDKAIYKNHRLTTSPLNVCNCLFIPWRWIYIP